MPEIIARTKRRYRPFVLKFWKRDVGSLWLPFERQQIEEYSRIKTNDKVSIDGYVKWISNNIFALVPTQISNQIYMLCLNHTDLRPRENEYITVSGTAEWCKIRRRPQTPEYLNVFKGVKIIQVYDWLSSKPDVAIPKTDFTFEDFKRDLTHRIEGLEPKQVDFLAFAALSTPSFLENVGGVNLTLYDSTEMGLPRQVVREMRRVIPPDIGMLHPVKTPFGNFGMRYKYGFFAGNADRPLSKRDTVLLTQRTHKFIKEYDESSLSLFSAHKRPRTIEDPPCSSSDVPTVVPEDTDINVKKRADPDLDSFKYMIINHMKTPIIQRFDTALINIVNKLEKLRDSYGLDPVHLTQYGFLNANYHARPTSIVRKSLAFARAQDIDVVSPESISAAFEDYFKWNFDFVYEIWEDLLRTGRKIPPSVPVEHRKVFRIIRRCEESKGFGVSSETILRESKMPSLQTEEIIKELLRSGLLYEPTPGFYRLVPG